MGTGANRAASAASETWTVNMSEMLLQNAELVVWLLVVAICALVPWLFICMYRAVREDMVDRQRGRFEAQK